MFSSTTSSHRFLALIVVPTSLRRTVFVAYHALGVGAHMGGWKTMTIFRMRFYWPHMRKRILDWVNMCASCIPARSQVRASSGLVHSWPVTTPFTIISADICLSGDIKNINGQKALMNAMCDMCQWVVLVAITGTEASYLVRMFMEHVLLKFGLYLMVVIDDGNKFRGTFESMCNAFCIRFYIVSKWNHKAVGVERFHKFLNHSQRISTEARGTSGPFVEVGMATVYAWNASTIDGTEIIRSVTAIGHTLRFPLDFDIAAIPDLIDNLSESGEQVNEKQYIVKYKPYRKCYGQGCRAKQTLCWLSG